MEILTTPVLGWVFLVESGLAFLWCMFRKNKQNSDKI